MSKARALSAGETARAISATAALDDAACFGTGVWWVQLEKRWMDAETREQAREIVQPALDICAGCPVVAACARWASIDLYTGVAAAAVYVNGTPRQPGWMVNRRGLVDRAAS